MNDRIKRAKEEYRKRFFNRSDNTGAFFTSDFYEVKELSEKIGGGGYSNILYEAISTALEAGFMIGYRRGKKEARTGRG